MNLCGCGCRSSVKNRFVHGHYWQGKHRREKTKDKIRQTLKGRTKETHDYVRRMGEKVSITLKEKYALGERKSWSKGKTKKTHSSVLSMADKLTGRTKENHEGVRRNAKKNSKTQKKRWEDLEFKEKQLRAMCNGMNIRPTSYEQRIIDLINKHNLPYKYVGDWGVIIGGKCPDFIHTNGEKMLLEIYDTTNKRIFDKLKNYEKQRYNHFVKYGFKTIFFNEHDLFRPNWEEHCLNKMGVI